MVLNAKVRSPWSQILRFSNEEKKLVWIKMRAERQENPFPTLHGANHHESDFQKRFPRGWEVKERKKKLISVFFSSCPLIKIRIGWALRKKRVFCFFKPPPRDDEKQWKRWIKNGAVLSPDLSRVRVNYGSFDPRRLGRRFDLRNDG